MVCAQFLVGTGAKLTLRGGEVVATLQDREVAISGGVKTMWNRADGREGLLDISRRAEKERFDCINAHGILLWMRSRLPLALHVVGGTRWPDMDTALVSGGVSVLTRTRSDHGSTGLPALDQPDDGPTLALT